MHILVCGWLGSTNLGDELVFRGLQRLLGHDHTLSAVSIDPAATERIHAVPAIDHRRVDLVSRAVRRADLVVFGGGGLVQDETSPFNLPYHLSRPWLARAGGTPWVGIGLGVGPLHTTLGRTLARSLRTATALSVRDPRSRRELTSIGVPALLGADTAFHLAGATPTSPQGSAATEDVDAPGDPRARVEVDDASGHIAVALRPWTSQRSALPVGWRRSQPAPDWFVDTLAASLDRLQERSGWPVELVALQTDRDHRLHESVATRMRHRPRLVVPTVDEVVPTLGRARLVIAMRYHAGIAATLTGRPSVLIGYSPKVTALADDLARGAVHVPFERAAIAQLDTHAMELDARHDAVAAVHSGLRALTRRAEVNAEVLRRATR